MNLSYSITLSSFLNLEKISETLKKISVIGFEKVEMFGEPDLIDSKYVSDIISSFNFKVIGITGMWGNSGSTGWKRRILSNDLSFRKYSFNYLVDCIDLCNELGGNKINICLFSDPMISFDFNHGFISKNIKENILCKSFTILKDLTKVSEDYGIQLLIEPLNRYSTPFCSTLDDSLFIIENCNELKVLLDTFHMNIEEDSFRNAIYKSKNFIEHLHFADNNRKMPGFGHINFEEILLALKEISYSKTISYEPTVLDVNYIDDLKFGKKYIEKMEKFCL